MVLVVSCIIHRGDNFPVFLEGSPKKPGFNRVKWTVYFNKYLLWLILGCIRGQKDIALLLRGCLMPVCLSLSAVFSARK